MAPPLTAYKELETKLLHIELSQVIINRKLSITPWVGLVVVTCHVSSTGRVGCDFSLPLENTIINDYDKNNVSNISWRNTKAWDSWDHSIDSLWARSDLCGPVYWIKLFEFFNIQMQSFDTLIKYVAGKKRPIEL